MVLVVKSRLFTLKNSDLIAKNLLPNFFLFFLVLYRYRYLILYVKKKTTVGRIEYLNGFFWDPGTGMDPICNIAEQK